MRNKYKNLQNRGQSQKGSSFLIPEKRNQIISDNNINYINKNSFISNIDRKDLNENFFIKNNDKEKKRYTYNKDDLKAKKLDTNILQKKNNNTIKTSNHNILISVYKKESSKMNSISNSNTNKSLIRTRNDNSNNISINNTVNQNNHRNSKRIFTNRKHQISNQNLLEKKQNSNDKKEKIIKNKDKNQTEIIELKNNGYKKKNDDSYNDNKKFLNYRRKKNCSSYNNIINNTDIEKENTNNKNNDDKKLKSEIMKKEKIFNNIHNYNSTNNISALHKTENINNSTQNFNSTRERNIQDKKKLLNFRKIRNKENDSRDDKSVNSPTASSYILSPNNNNLSRVKRKMTYRSKRVIKTNKNQEEKESSDKDNIYKDEKRRKYLIKVTKTPDEINTNKNLEESVKTEDLNANKKKIRHFLYYKSSKEKEDKEKKEDKREKETHSKKNMNLFSPKNIENSTIIQSFQSENSNSPQITFKRINNKVYKISPKQSFKDLLHEANQNKNLHDSFSNIFQSCKNDISNKNYDADTIKSQDLNKSFTCFSNELELNLGNKNILFNYINSSNLNKNKNNTKNNITSSNINTYKNNSVMRNKNNNIKSQSPSNIIYRKKMNLIKSISNYYKKNMGILSPKIMFNSNSNSDIRKYNNLDKITVKSSKKENSLESKGNISNNIINNNTYNTTLNIYKMNEISPKEFKDSNNIIITKVRKGRIQEESQQFGQEEQQISSISQKSKKHLRTNSEFSEVKSSLYFSIFNENNNNINSNLNNFNSNINNSKKNKSNNSRVDLSEIINNNTKKSNEEYRINKNFKIDLEILYILEVKLKNILNKINIYTVCPGECFDLITYYFSSKFYEKEINIFNKSKHNINNISYYIKLELLCYFLCYDVCFNKSFNQTGILLKTIFNLLNSNYLILISFIINDGLNHENNNTNNSNTELLMKLKSIIRNELKITLSQQDFNETNILSLIGKNLKEVNTYYKMIIDNLYSHFYMKKNSKKDYNDTKYKFPHCLQLDINDLDYYEKLNIISLFFFDAYRLLNNYNFEDLKYFFDSFLQRIKFSNKKKTEKKIKSPKKRLSEKKGLNMKNVVIYKYNYSNGNFYYLPPIKKCYKYTLVLDLDETLVYLMPNNIYLNEEGKVGEAKHTLIFRPGLLDFLKKMKPLFELVIFSFGTYDYVDNVLKIIEKSDKFFEHVLYRQHATINNGEYIKDLSLLGRDLKNIIIVDDIPQVFKMQERNGICIKAFYGDIVTERNTLKILGKILERVRFDADEDGDIRKSLDKQRNLIFTHITNTGE